MRSDPDYDDYVNRWVDLYRDHTYDQGPTGYFVRKSHVWSEKQFGPDIHFERVVEVGAGFGEHIKHVRHSFDEYWVTDLNLQVDEANLLANFNGGGEILFSKEDATKLSFENEYCDRVVAAHILEHLYKPHEVIREWMRILKPGGVMTLVLPCDPGLLWRLGRYALARKNMIKAGLDYDYWMAREHINPINNLVSFIRYYFPSVEENWLPCRIPSIDINLFYIVHVQK